MEENNKLKSKIELQRFLTPQQIEDLLDQAVRAGAANDYVGKVQIQALLDALNSQGHMFENRFQIDGNEVIPKGTYEFIGEEDLGKPIGKCENYACGHAIRYAEHIKHVESGREFVVGNVCVKHLLGEHDLIEIAIALLSKISQRVDKLNKAKRIREILGNLPDKIREADPDQLITAEEQKFFRAVDKNQSSPTIKRAQEIRDKWLGNLPQLINAVERKIEVLKKTNGKHETLNEINSWLEFLKFKEWDSKSRNQSTDFFRNCIDEIKVHDRLSEHRKAKLLEGKSIYDRIRTADPTLMIAIDSREDRLFISKMLNHSKTCDNYFIISLLFKANHFGNLTPNQKDSIRKGCRHCKGKIL